MAGVSDGRLLWAVILNQLLTVGQVAAGAYSGSVALLFDAAHNFNDANALLIAYVARKVSQKQANQRYTFGYRRAEMIGALINLTLLAVIGLYLVYEGVKRFLEPEPILGWVMAATAVLALVVDAATALLLRAMSRGSLNVRAAFLHNVVDALGSLAVLIGAGAIIWGDWTWVDPAITLLIAGYVLWQVAKMYPQATRMLMEGAPQDFDFRAMIERIKQLDGIDGVHHVHHWQLDEQHTALEAQVVLCEASLDRWESIKRHVKLRLAEEFGIERSTLEFELAETTADACAETDAIARH